MKVILPRHVRACVHSAECLERWFLWFWRKASPDNQTRVPYTCGSWRCPVCGRHEAAVTFRRFTQAIDATHKAESHAPDAPVGWVYAVLTLDRDSYYGGRAFRDVNAAFGALSAMTRKALERIGRRWGWTTKTYTTTNKRTGKKRQRHVRTLGNRWVSTVEVHRSGWPHVNLWFWCPELADELRREHAERLEDPEVADAVALARDAWSRKEPIPGAVRERARRATVVGGELRELVEDSGWGRQSTAEVPRSIEAVAAYGVKLAGLHDVGLAELAKLTQAPLNAPERFRRLRAGRGFLPARYCNEEVTGCMVRRRRSRERFAQGHEGAEHAEWEVTAINGPKDPAQAEAVQRARAAELALIDEEERLLSQWRRLPPMPPLRHARAGKLEGHAATSERRGALLQRGLSACA